MVTEGRFWAWESRDLGDFVVEWLWMALATFVFGQIRGIGWKYSYVFRRSRVSLVPTIVSLYFKLRPIGSYASKYIYGLLGTFGVVGS